MCNVLALLQDVWNLGSVLGLRADNPRERIRDEGRHRPRRWAPAADAAARRSPSVPPQVFHVFQVRGTARARRPLLPAGGQPHLRAGLAQAGEGVRRCGRRSHQRWHWCTQGQGRPTEAEQGLDG